MMQQVIATVRQISELDEDKGPELLRTLKCRSELAVGRTSRYPDLARLGEFLDPGGGESRDVRSCASEFAVEFALLGQKLVPLPTRRRPALGRPVHRGGFGSGPA
jgi:hypothetical protein